MCEKAETTANGLLGSQNDSGGNWKALSVYISLVISVFFNGFFVYSKTRDSSESNNNRLFSYAEDLAIKREKYTVYENFKDKDPSNISHDRAFFKPREYYELREFFRMHASGPYFLKLQYIAERIDKGECEIPFVYFVVATELGYCGQPIKAIEYAQKGVDITPDGTLFKIHAYISYGRQLFSAAKEFKDQKYMKEQFEYLVDEMDNAFRAALEVQLAKPVHLNQIDTYVFRDYAKNTWDESRRALGLEPLEK